MATGFDHSYDLVPSEVDFSYLCCPRCKSSLINSSECGQDSAYLCANRFCEFATAGFPDIDGVPALVDFERSILSREATISARGSSYKARRTKSLYQRLRAKLLREPNVAADRFAATFIKEVKSLADRPIVLVIGGGSMGSARPIHEDADIELVSSDIYRSSATTLIADGHHLPLKDGSCHGVWIGAVLEHVLTPSEVVAEIHRVLAPGGVVFAESPFMQQVHEGPYDFTRFTVSGHRWLFRNFEEIDHAVSNGPGTVLLWAIRYYAASLTGSYKIGTALSLMFFWLRLPRRLQNKAFVVDGASASMFLGRRSDTALSPKTMVKYYSGAQ